MELFDYYLRYMTELLEGKRPAPEGITLTAEDEEGRTRQITEQLASMGAADFVRACAAQDGEALHAALGKDAAYVGMLGSRRKIAALFERLRSLGVPQAQLDTVCTPIGFDPGGETPEELAIAILAQILLVKNRGRQALTDAKEDKA